MRPCNAKHWCEELKQGLVGVVCACGLQTEVASVLCVRSMNCSHHVVGQYMQHKALSAYIHLKVLSLMVSSSAACGQLSGTNVYG